MICDVHSALTERRVYREPMPAARARAIMSGMSGKLDPDLLRAYAPILAVDAVPIGALARYDRPMPTIAEYDVLLSGPYAGTA